MGKGRCHRRGREDDAKTRKRGNEEKGGGGRKGTYRHRGDIGAAGVMLVAWAARHATPSPLPKVASII